VSRWVALLRGVNVGGHRRLPMADLRRELSRRGAEGPRTYLQSGNAVLDLPDADEAAVVALTVEAAAALGVDCDVVVRSAEQLAEVVRRLPWPDRAATAPTWLHVGFLSCAVEGAARGLSPEEEVRFDGREAWLWYGAGAGRSRMALDVGDAVLTARNWRTVTALVEVAGDGQVGASAG
jgi:uncharacterized protein (DUF1697 family)